MRGISRERVYVEYVGEDKSRAYPQQQVQRLGALDPVAVKIDKDAEVKQSP